jgi:hypothetical protein
MIQIKNNKIVLDKLAGWVTLRSCGKRSPFPKPGTWLGPEQRLVSLLSAGGFCWPQIFLAVLPHSWRKTAGWTPHDQPRAVRGNGKKESVCHLCNREEIPLAVFGKMGPMSPGASGDDLGSTRVNCQMKGLHLSLNTLPGHKCWEELGVGDIFKNLLSGTCSS